MMWSSDYLAKVPFDVTLAAVGGDDQQDEQGRSQHHLVGGGSLRFTAVWAEVFNCCLGGNAHSVAGSWTIETPRGCLSFALPGALDNYSA